MPKKGGKRGGGGRGGQSQSKPAAPTLDELLSRVEELLEQGDAFDAESLLRHSALLGRMRPDDIGPSHASLAPALELMAQVQLALNRPAQAFAWLQRLVQLQPDKAENWMIMGQLLSGHDALTAYGRGVECMRRAHEAAVATASNAQASGSSDARDRAAEASLLSKQLASGYSAMAELFLTDLCDEEGADVQAGDLLQRALAASPNNPDVLYQLANLRYTQARVEQAKRVEAGQESAPPGADEARLQNEAVSLLARLFDTLAACRARSIESMPVLAVAAQLQGDGLDSAIDENDVSYELRVDAAKLAIEMERYEPALQLLEQLLEESDRVLEVSHLAALAAFHLGQPALSLEHIAHAESLLAMQEAMDAAGSSDFSMHPDDDGDDDPESAARKAEEVAATKRALAELKQNAQQAVQNMPADAAAADDDGEEEKEGEADDADMQD